MESATVKEKLISILRQIQDDSGLECPPLTGKTIPVKELPEFESMVWPAATTLLAVEINAAIPDDVNIFIDDGTNLPRSIDEMADYVCKVCEGHKEQVSATT